MTAVLNAPSPVALRVRTIGLSLTAFFVLSFVLCVLGGVLFPGVIVHRMLDLLLPGFTSLS
jgi:hypothetical protein